MEPPAHDHVRTRLTFLAIAASVSLLVTLVGGVGTGAYLWAQQKLEDEGVEIHPPESPAGTATPEAPGGCAERECNYLLIGSDSREGLSKEEQRQFGSDEDIGGENRADTIILVHTEPDRERAVLVHFPRDLWVQIPGRGWGKINGAFEGGIDGGGPRRVVETVEDLTGLRIQHLLYVDLAGFQDIVDAMDGVPMCIDRPLYDELTGLDFPRAGCYKFDGYQALAYVRTRHIGTECVPDFARIQRQQQFLRAVLNKVLSPSQVTNLPDLVPAVLDGLRADEDLDPAELVYLAGQLQGVTTGAADFRAVPGVPGTIYPTEYPSGISVVELQQPQAEELFRRLRESKPLGSLGKELSQTPPSPANIVVGTFDRRSGGAAHKVLSTLTKSGFNVDPGLADVSALDTDEKGSLILYSAGAEEEAKVVAHFAPNLDLVEAPKEVLGGMDVAVVISSGYEVVPPGSGEVPPLEDEC